MQNIRKPMMNNKMINDTQFKSIIYLGVINGNQDK